MWQASYQIIPLTHSGVLGVVARGSVGLFLGLWALFPRWLGKLVRAGVRSLFPSYYAVAFLGTTRPEESENLNLDFPHNRGEKRIGEKGRGDTILLSGEWTRDQKRSELGGIVIPRPLPRWNLENVFFSPLPLYT